MGSRTVKGRLVFSQDVEGAPKPLHSMRLELWDLDLRANQSVASGTSALDGTFELSYDPDVVGASWFEKPDLVLRLLDRDYHYGDDEKPHDSWHLIAAFHRSTDLPPPGPEVDFGTLRVGYWEYEDPQRRGAVAFTPRVAVVDGEVPQSFRPGRKLEQATVIARFYGAYAKGMLENARDPKLPAIAPMNEEFPQNLTRSMGAEKADSDEYLCELVLNGFNPCVLERGEQEGELFVDFSWEGLAQDGQHFAPDTRANFVLDEGELKLQSIVVRQRAANAASEAPTYAEPVTYTADHPAWKGVKRLFRVNYFLFGEVTTHLGATHLNVEQYIVALRRNVHLNPVARLLYPHFYGTVAVNLGANNLLIAPEGLIPKTSAVTPTSVAQIAIREFSGYDWKGFRPRAPLCESHRYAKLAGMFWEVAGNYVEDAFTRHEDDIREHWVEIKRFSDELVAHAVPYVERDPARYYDGSEVNSPDKDHPEVGGRRVALSRVTTSETANDEGIANLKQVCRYLIYLATFQHSWVNDAQYAIGGEVRFATLGVTGDLTDPTVVEGPLEEQVLPYDALQHPFFTYMLTKTRYGYVLRNEDDDMSIHLRERLANRQAEFLRLGLDVRWIRSRINT